MNDLIEALKILAPYNSDNQSPTHCEHDILLIAHVDPNDVSEEEKKALDGLGLFITDEYGESGLASYRFGSA